MHSVLNVLHSFVDKSNIDQQLEVFNASPGMLLLYFYSTLIKLYRKRRQWLGEEMYGV